MLAGIQQPRAQMQQGADARQLEPIMSRPRPATRRFHLDRPDFDRLYGASKADRLRSKIPQKIIAAQTEKARGQ